MTSKAIFFESCASVMLLEEDSYLSLHLEVVVIKKKYTTTNTITFNHRHQKRFPPARFQTMSISTSARIQSAPERSSQSWDQSKLQSVLQARDAVSLAPVLDCKLPKQDPLASRHHCLPQSSTMVLERCAVCVQTASIRGMLRC